MDGQRSAPGLDAPERLGGVFLLVGMVFGSSGFGGQTTTGFGDHTMTSSEVERAQASTLAIGLVLLLAVVAVVVRIAAPPDGQESRQPGSGHRSDRMSLGFRQ